MAKKVEQPVAKQTLGELIGEKIAVLNQRLDATTAASDLQKVGQSVLNLSVSLAQYALCGNSNEFDNEIELLLLRVRSPLAPTDLQQLTQAVLHYMQAKATLAGIGNPVQTTRLGTSAN